MAARRAADREPRPNQAWIESLNGTIKGEWPHLLAITDPVVLRAELDSPCQPELAPGGRLGFQRTGPLDTMRAGYNSIRLSLGVENVWRDVA